MIVNPSFETIGAGPGLADGWTFASTASAETYATFNTADPWETFEAGWSNDTYLYSLTLGNTTAGEFQTAAPTPKFVENFEEFWDSNQSYSYGIDGTVADFDTAAGTLPVESFESYWVSGYLYALSATTTAIFNSADPVEPFEAFWNSNHLYKYAFTGVGTDLTAATFDSAPESVEDFEEDWAASVMTTV